MNRYAALQAFGIREYKLAFVWSRMVETDDLEDRYKYTTLSWWGTCSWWKCSPAAVLVVVVLPKPGGYLRLVCPTLPDFMEAVVRTAHMSSMPDKADMARFGVTDGYLCVEACDAYGSAIARCRWHVSDQTPAAVPSVPYAQLLRSPEEEGREYVAC